MTLGWNGLKTNLSQPIADGVVVQTRCVDIGGKAHSEGGRVDSVIDPAKQCFLEQSDLQFAQLAGQSLIDS